MKSNMDKELKELKKYLTVDRGYLNKLHSDLRKESFFNERNNKRGSGYILRKLIPAAACLLLVILGNLYAKDTAVKDVAKNPIPVVENKENHTRKAGNLVLLCDNNKFGFMDLSGKVVIEPQFDYASGFNEHGVATVMKYSGGERYYGLLGLNGMLTDINLWDIYPFCEGIAKVKSKEGKYGFIDFTGKWIAEPVYNDAKDFSEGMAAVAFKAEDNEEKKGDETFIWGYINNWGEEIIKPQYQKADSYSQGLAYVQERGIWKTAPNHYINKKGEIKITLPWQWVLGASGFTQDGTAIIQRVSEENRAISLAGVINTKGELIIPFDYSYITSAVDGLRIAAPNKEGISNSGIIDAKGKWVVEPKYFEVGPIKDGLVRASVIKGGRQHTGILKVDGSWLYEPKNYGIFSFRDDMVVFIEDTGIDGVGTVMSLYNLKGNQLLKCKKFNNIEILSKDFIRCGNVIDNSKALTKWSIYSPEGIELMPDANIWSARLLPDGSILAAVLGEEGFLLGTIDGSTKNWIIEPRYEKVIKYSKGSGAGIRKVKEKCTENTVVFVIEIFDSKGRVNFVTPEETMSLSNFTDILLNEDSVFTD